VETCDVFVIGGGPGGSTIAALLAERGRNVVVVDKSHHPRFHIGESLLPLNMPLFDELGVGEEIRDIGMRKFGAEFVSPWHEHVTRFEFADAWDRSFPSAYQVRSSEFDEVLFRNAARKGATALEGWRVRDVEFHPDGVTVAATAEDGAERRWRARFLVDATGRDTFLANRFQIKRRNEKHNSSAIFGHFTGVRRHEGIAEGDITIFWFDHGWFWLIPLTDGTTSIGAVCWPYYMKSREVPPEQFLLDTIAMCPKLAERMRDAKLVSPVTATGNYSYTAKRTAGRNYLMIGDAFAFIDPVFSSGVYFAMHTAFEGARTVATCLDRPREAARAMKAFDASSRRGLDIFSWFIYRVTNPAMRELFMRPTDRFRLKAALLSVLAGDIYRGTPIGASLLLFKGVYYFYSLRNWRQTFAAWRRRRQIIREPAAA